MWAGVDVGGLEKGFHASVVDDRRLVLGPARLRSTTEAAAWIRASGAALVAIDSPISCASPGFRSRECEREVAARVCGIRYTPDEATVRADSPYYEWIRNGLDLYDALEQAGIEAIECFPTASFTRWGGSRGVESRAAWSRRTLTRLELEGVPKRLSQDARDAIAAALTARAYARGRAQSFGDIVVPYGSRAMSAAVAIASGDRS